MNAESGFELAIVGMACRFPGSPGVEAYWENIRAGVECITTLSPSDLTEAGVPADIQSDEGYVPRAGLVDGAELFDARLFGYAPSEAQRLDPQQRLFLETAWEALDHAGYGGRRYRGVTGLYAGSGPSMYLVRGLAPREDLAGGSLHDLWLANDKDYLATRTAYHLGLTGPCITVQTACSTSLVAVHLASQALLAQECDLALAGGVTVRFPRKRGYRYEPGDVVSADGHTYVFDARATGFVPSEGVGVVALKRLADAVRDGDVIHAVVKGSAVANDGSVKVGFTAPGVEGQTTTLRLAQQVSDVDPSTIGYLEAHGTGTAVGDPIEFTALCRAFGDADEPYCALGSVKALVGHMDAAAGVGGLIKAVLAVHNGLLPPSPYLHDPNPAVKLPGTAFHINTEPLPWPERQRPRRAGVSSFGIGGTNAHVVIEEPPVVEPSGGGRADQLILLSAPTETALARMRDRLATAISDGPAVLLADAAHTLRVGRRAFNHRMAFVARTSEEADAVLRDRTVRSAFTGVASADDRDVVFMFPGQGAQHPGMGGELYETEPTYRRWVDTAAELLRPHLDRDVRDIIDGDASTLEQTRFTQPALFVVEYALAQLWLEWGLRPRALIGHSVGEYVAACVAGVLDLPAALDLVVTRGRLLQQVPPGAMVSVQLAAADVVPVLTDGLAIAADNAPGLCAVAGAVEAVEEFERRLDDRGVLHRRLHTTRAFHSPMVEPILSEFADSVARLRLAAPRIPIVSNVTGGWLSTQDATSVAYWVRHVREPVRFRAGVELLLGDDRQILIEVGPGETLATLVRQHDTEGHAILTSLPAHRRPQPQSQHLLTALGRAWIAGAAVDWTGFVRHERRRRALLPAYPFERERFWIDPPTEGRPGSTAWPLSTARPEAQGAVTPHDGPPPQAYAPQQPAEAADLRSQVRAIWADALGLPDIGDRDNFFELGGHSLLATRILARIRPLAGVDLTANAMFEAPTIDELVALIERDRDGRGDASTPGLIPELLAELQALSIDDAGPKGSHRD